ncbi:MAG: hypothetical protein ACRYG8_16350 [Janthinobacterium lividum]
MADEGLNVKIGCALPDLPKAKLIRDGADVPVIFSGFTTMRA